MDKLNKNIKWSRLGKQHIEKNRKKWKKKHQLENNQ